MTKKQIFRVVLALVIAIVFFSSFKLQEAFNNAAAFFEELIRNQEILGGAIFVGLAALSAMLSPFSSIPLVPIAAVIWGNVLTFVLLLAGWVLGGVVSYYVGRFAAYPLLRHLVPFEKIQFYLDSIPKKSQFWMILLFRLALPSEIPGYVLGTIRYHFGKYLIATFLAEVPFAFIAIYAGDAFVDKRPALFLSVVATGLLLVSLLFYLLNKQLKKK